MGSAFANTKLVVDQGLQIVFICLQPRIAPSSLIVGHFLPVCTNLQGSPRSTMSFDAASNDEVSVVARLEKAAIGQPVAPFPLWAVDAFACVRATGHPPSV